MGCSACSKPSFSGRRVYNKQGVGSPWRGDLLQRRTSLVDVANAPGPCRAALGHIIVVAQFARMRAPESRTIKDLRIAHCAAPPCSPLSSARSAGQVSSSEHDGASEVNGGD
jgi:hypothetical protein